VRKGLKRVARPDVAKIQQALATIRTGDANHLYPAMIAGVMCAEIRGGKATITVRQ